MEGAKLVAPGLLDGAALQYAPDPNQMVHQFSCNSVMIQYETMGTGPVDCGHGRTQPLKLTTLNHSIIPTSRKSLLLFAIKSLPTIRHDDDDE
jgi:hypothetical protein